MKRVLTKEDWKSLWGILWRVLLFGPILFPLGVAILVLILGFLLIPPCYALLAITSGDVLLGLAVGGVWLVLLRFSRRLLRKVFEGWEYTGI
jgi:hypothetical protein